MKRKFYFQRENAPLKADTVIYIVWVGESERDAKSYAQVNQYAMKHGCTFRRWDEAIDEFLSYEEDRVFLGSSLLRFGFVKAEVQVAQMANLCSDGCFDKFEKSLAIPKNKIQMLGVWSPILIKEKTKIPSNQNCPALQRKNLSHSSPVIEFL